jgi:hypothetical protein
VWRGRAEVALDAAVSFKYVQLDGSGGLVAWGQDIAGGSNISLMVTPSDEVMSGLQLTVEPTEAAGGAGAWYGCLFGGCCRSGWGAQQQ